MKSSEQEIEGIHYESGIPVRLHVRDGLIVKISEIKKYSGKGSELYIAPGLIDNQVNGYYGVDFSDPSLDNGNIRKAAQAIWKDGVTTFLPTLLTGSHDNLIKNFRTFSLTVDDPFFRGTIPGYHLEGPYLSPEPGFYGCHPAEHLSDPSWPEFQEFQTAAGGKILEITLAPELKGAQEFIKKCTESGMIVSLGHTNASAEQVDLAVRKGARLSTHLGNGCANMIHRHLNPLWSQLADDRLVATIIADGHHLLPEEIMVFYRAKGPQNIILISDVTYLIGMPAGLYEYMGSRVLKTEDGLIKNTALDCLAGASMPLKKGMETMLKVTGCSLGEAINMASLNVARVIGLRDRGMLEPGKRADLIVFEKTDNKITIRETYLAGEKVF